MTHYVSTSEGIICFQIIACFFLITKIILVIVEIIQSTNEQKTINIAFLSSSKEFLFFYYDSETRPFVNFFEKEKPLVAIDRNLVSTGLGKILFVGSRN